jgi:hypothetical protein
LLRLGFDVVVVAGLAGASRGADEKLTQNSIEDITVTGKGEWPPHLVFACDGSASDIEKVLSQPGVISDLRELKAGISLALPDLSAERARIVRELNQAEIPVTAWLALPGEQGYYLNAGNAPAASARFAEFEKWSAAYGLRWAGIGLDIEPNIQEFAAIKGSGKWRIAGTLIARYFEPWRVERARKWYGALIQDIHAHGYPVETYQFPFTADERKVHSTLLERVAGLVDVRGDREALMLYTSFNPALDSALIWAYGPDAQAIAVGSTAGSESDPRFVPLTWEEFTRDLMVAHHFSRVIGVYNLQGCIAQGFLHRLSSVDWNQSVSIPAVSVQKAMQFRKRVQIIIWIGSNLPYFVLSFVILVLAVFGFRRRVRST